MIVNIEQLYLTFDAPVKFVLAANVLMDAFEMINFENIFFVNIGKGIM